MGLFRALTFLVFIVCHGAGAEVSAPLFNSSEPITLHFEAPFADLLAKIDRNDSEKTKNQKERGLLRVGKRVIKVSLNFRGNSTLQHCSFPKLAMEWDKSEVKGTPFEGLKKIGLGTHCMTREEFEAKTDWTRVYAEGMQFPYREALVYRWAEVLGLATYHVRPALVTYVDTSLYSPLPTATHMAILLEPGGAFRKRINGSEVEWKSLDDALPRLDQKTMARVILFESLIGNADWSISKKIPWNIEVVSMPSGRWHLIPEDFGLTTAVLGWKPEIIPWERDDYKFFASMPKAVRESAIRHFLAKKKELIAELPMLGIDPVGHKILVETLDIKFAEFARQLSAN